MNKRELHSEDGGDAASDAQFEHFVMPIESRVVYENPWMRVREDRVRFGDHAVGTYGVVEKPNFALILPRDKGGFWMVEQYRYPVRRRAWEFPQGSGSAGDNWPSIEEMARGELRQETGIRASDWQHLGFLYSAYGFSSLGFDVFLASALSFGEVDREATEMDMTHRFVSDRELESFVDTGALVDSASLAALSLWRLRRDDGKSLLP